MFGNHIDLEIMADSWSLTYQRCSEVILTIREESFLYQRWSCGNHYEHGRCSAKKKPPQKRTA